MKQKIWSFNADDVQKLADGIADTCKKGYWVQCMTTVHNKVLVVFNKSEGTQKWEKAGEPPFA